MSLSSMTYLVVWLLALGLATTAGASHLVYGGTTFTDPGDGMVLVDTPPLTHQVHKITATINARSEASMVLLVDVRDARGNVTRTTTIMAGHGDTTALLLSGVTASPTDRLRVRLVGGIRGTIRVSLTAE